MDSALLIFIAVGSVIHVAAIAVIVTMLRDSIRITKAVGALVIQEEEKTRRLFQR